ncbi:hypothetical protein [Acidithiobacillus sulfurivorans]|uniref:Uncharacterized protein n=1 Tax=Acidithiobacillus sulfurivorans TaxID=1958756 RepID=A0ABS6A155_9PROT|nr:hypothetical protein [Acidithiobacillus sulfurivorans]MBU2761242.1 hypothetical protein [Acidithiobacillus sulfurivorans]
MNAEDLIEAIRDAGASTDEDVKAALEDGEALGHIMGLAPLDPDDAASVAAHAEAQGIVEEAHASMI